MEITLPVCVSRSFNSSYIFHRIGWSNHLRILTATQY
jgi:hypothetical protein